MLNTKNILAFDLGAESGRAIVGRFDGTTIQLDVIHRFANGPVKLPDGMYWDALRLFQEIKAGLGKAAQEHGTIDSLGVDTWGVDFALMGHNDCLLSNPRHYRDPHTEIILEESFARVPRAEIFAQTGLQFIQFNSLFQLLAMQRDKSPALESARSLLFMPDLFHFWFTGEKANEYTITSTSQMYDPTTRDWAVPLLEKFELSKSILGRIAQPGTQLGTLLPDVANELNCGPVPVILPASHDTGAAVAAVPATGESWCYISSGTWSLMGVEIPGPIVDDRCLEHNFTNEGGVGGTIRLLKNIMGLWLVQECRRIWEREGQSFSYEELARSAAQAMPLQSIVNPDDSSFWLPVRMPEAIAGFCRKTGQDVPMEPGSVVRCALESLALRYRSVLETLEHLLGRRLDVIHIVGGGSQNTLLNQFAADACNRPVLAGPVEATAIGNVMTQCLGLGEVGSLAEAREIVGASLELKRFEPRPSRDWDEAYGRFCTFLN